MMRPHRISGGLQRQENESLKREEIWKRRDSGREFRGGEEGKREFVRGEK
jgi:hypothetical protein